jgi:hypothetical protein
MAGNIYLTDNTGKPIANQPINIVSGPTLPGNPPTPEYTDANGLVILIVPNPGTYGLSTTFQGQTFTNSITFNSIGIASDLHWRLSVSAVSACQQAYGDWGVFNPVRNFVCWVQGLATS